MTDALSDLFPERIETERLVLERLCHENVDALTFHDAFAAGNADPAVFEWIPQDAFETPMDAHDWLDDAEESWRENDGAEYAVRPKPGEPGAGELAGLAHLYCDWEQTGRLGLILRRPFWGRGYSGERAAALFEVAFDRLDLQLVEAGCNVGNEKSRRAIAKYVEQFGGRYEGRLRSWVPMDERGADCQGRVDDYHRFTVSRAEWQANR